jgi:hypothetical protein
MHMPRGDDHVLESRVLHHGLKAVLVNVTILDNWRKARCPGPARRLGIVIWADSSGFITCGHLSYFWFADLEGVVRCHNVSHQIH